MNISLKPADSKIRRLAFAPPLTEHECLFREALSIVIAAFKASKTSWMAYKSTFGFSPDDAIPILRRFSSLLQGGLSALDHLQAIDPNPARLAIIARRDRFADTLTVLSEMIVQSLQSPLSVVYLERVDAKAVLALADFHFVIKSYSCKSYLSAATHFRRRRNWILTGVVLLIIAVSYGLFTLKPRFLYPLDYDRRMKDLKILKDSLEKYHEDHGGYPVSRGFDGLFTLWGEARSDWIVGLAPKYISQLPRDPRNNFDPANQYLYKSDGTDYKLIAHHPGDCDNAKIDNPALVDPVRDCFAYGIWTSGAEKW
ncbi:MAG: hypothetical protein HQK81_03600 [Desulfovibrionaceae bacterium]|nr:hypothetical protein [Desulfovibrionaceae bacterium]MBF0513127.1 hypothetical protein [Desulfovibrionaceae bacterium]